MIRCAAEGCQRGVQHPRVGLCDTHYQRRQQELHVQRERRGIRETGRERQQGLEAVQCAAVAVAIVEHLDELIEARKATECADG